MKIIDRIKAALVARPTDRDLTALMIRATSTTSRSGIPMMGERF